MEPGEWARKALDIIESETRDLVHSGAPLTPNSETDVEIAPLFRKPELHRLRKSKERSASCKRQEIFCNPRGSEFSARRSTTPPSPR
jgi:hypothetical protein